MNKNILISVITLLLLGCNASKLSITPIYEDFNNEAEFGIQYFDVDGYKLLPDSILLNKIVQFSENELSSKNLMPPKVEVQNFYKKTLYSPCKEYSNLRYEAREGEYGILRDCIYSAVSYIWYTEEDTINNTYTRWAVVFTQNGLARFASERTDSLKVVGTKWILLKQGKIEKKEVR